MKNNTILLIAGCIAACMIAGISWYVFSTAGENTYVSVPDGEATTTISVATSTGMMATSTQSTSASTSSAVVSTPPATTPPVSVAAVGHAIGISAGGGLGKSSIANINKQLDTMVANGVTWVRFDIEWGLVQYSSPDKYDWSGYDAMVDALKAHHLKGLAILLFTPQWARDPACSGGAKCPPKDPATFAKFAAAAVARYKDKGLESWEVWNEPNNYDFWATKTNCQAYTSLLKATYTSIKKVDPNATVVTGGLSPAATDANNISQLDFLSCIYANGGKNYFDAVGYHPYTFPKLPSSNTTNAWAQMSLTSPSFRSIMAANGDSAKKIWITEFGAPTGGPDSYWFVSEDGQAQMVADTIKQYKVASWAGPLFWYTLNDNGTDTSTIENFFGLLRADGSPKPALAALKAAISAGL